MKRIAMAAAALVLMAAGPATAQSDILLRLRSGSPLGDRFRIDSAGGVVAVSELGIGIIPFSGEGYRLMWHPFKASFRAGHADTEWDDASNGFFSWAGGNNTIASQYATFAFGDNTDATANYGVAFGNSVKVSGTYGFAAGISSRCEASACVAIGNTASALGDGAVALGYRVTADANYSVALGYRASTNGHAGAFAASDQSTTDSLEASANNQFNARYAGGYRLFTNATTTTGVSVAAGGGSWSAISDRNRKEHFLEIDPQEILARVRRLPVTTWRYIDEADRSTRHIGPMAQDWHAAFGFTTDDRTINSGDFDGVNLAAIQALDAEVTRLRAENEQLRAALQRQDETLRARLDRVEALLAQHP